MLTSFTHRWARSEPQPWEILPSARVGDSFETLTGEDSPHRSGWQKKAKEEEAQRTPDANTNMDFHRFDEQVR